MYSRTSTGRVGLGHQILVVIADAQVGNLLVVGRDHVVIADLSSRKLPAEISGRRPAEKSRPGCGSKAGDAFHRRPALPRR